jgi:ATP-dependent DNA helicase RecQ
VVSPLVALMENQVQELRDRNLPAALLHSELPTHHRRQTLQALERQQLRLLYLSPETLLSAPVWQRLCQPKLKINGLILDEAHCLVQWGETFRPAYRRLGAVRPALLKFKPVGTRIAIAAFTATADPKPKRLFSKSYN